MDQAPTGYDPGGNMETTVTSRVWVLYDRDLTAQLQAFTSYRITPESEVLEAKHRNRIHQHQPDDPAYLYSFRPFLWTAGRGFSTQIEDVTGGTGPDTEGLVSLTGSLTSTRRSSSVCPAVKATRRENGTSAYRAPSR